MFEIIKWMDLAIKMSFLVGSWDWDGWSGVEGISKWF